MYHCFSQTADIDALGLLTTLTVDNDDLVLGIVVLVCFSPSIIAWLVSIAEVSATSTSTVAVGDISDGIQSLNSPTVCSSIRPTVRPTVHSLFGKWKLLPYLALGTLCATWMALLAGSVSNSYPTRKDVKEATVACCETLLVLVGALNIVMPVVVAIARRDTCYTYSCCGQVKDKTVNQRRRGHDVREAKRRRSKGERERKSESSDKIENRLGPAIKMEIVETVDAVLADSIVGCDGGTMGNGLTTATVNHSSLSMALAFGIVFGGGLFAIRRKVSLKLMVVVVGKQNDKALMRNQNNSFFSLLVVSSFLFVPLLVFHPQLALMRWIC